MRMGVGDVRICYVTGVEQCLQLVVVLRRSPWICVMQNMDKLYSAVQCGVSGVNRVEGHDLVLKLAAWIASTLVMDSARGWRSWRDAGQGCSEYPSFWYRGV